MVKTEERIRSDAELDPTPHEILEPRRSSSGPQLLRRTADGRLLVAWSVTIIAMIALEPVANPSAVVPVWAEVVSLGFLFAFGATMYGLATGRSWRLRASGAAAGLGLVLAVGCAITDHHMGMWWSAEIAAFTALGALTFHSLRSAG